MSVEPAQRQQHLNPEHIRGRYPRLLRAMRWLGILSHGEALACLRDYRAGLAWSGEAVNHYGGTKALISHASEDRIRWLVAQYHGLDSAKGG